MNISVLAANLSDCRIESSRKNRFGSENRIESKLFCLNWNALPCAGIEAGEFLSRHLQNIGSRDEGKQSANISLLDETDHRGPGSSLLLARGLREKLWETGGKEVVQHIINLFIFVYWYNG